jgi:4-carboxymuconolactone decarboxylase
VAELGEALRFRGTLGDREREIAILLTAAHDRSAFEWYAHDRVARRLGMSEEELDALRSGQISAFPDPRESAIAAATTEVLATGDLSDASFAACRSVLTQPEVVELLVLIGHYRSLAAVMRVLQIEPPDASAAN